MKPFFLTYFFGEWAKTNQSWGYLNGMLLYLAPKLSFSALHRNYPKEFDFRYAQAFSENSKVGNEKGALFRNGVSAIS
jgi:hypothetical protein